MENLLTLAMLVPSNLASRFASHSALRCEKWVREKSVKMTSMVSQLTVRFKIRYLLALTTVDDHLRQSNHYHYATNTQLQLKLTCAT